MTFSYTGSFEHVPFETIYKFAGIIKVQLICNTLREILEEFDRILKIETLKENQQSLKIVFELYI